MSIELRQNGLTMTGGAVAPRIPRQRVVCRWRLLALAIPLLLGMASVAAPAMAQAQGKHCFVNQRVPIRAYTADTQQYGKWALICSAQPVDNKAVTLGLTVDIVQQNQQKVVQLIVRLPPAAKAGKDIRMVVDQNPPLQAAIGQCNEFGCLVRGALDENTLKLLRNGKAVAVTYLGEGSKPVTARASLTGFGQAFDALRKTAGL